MLCIGRVKQTPGKGAAFLVLGWMVLLAFSAATAAAGPEGPGQLRVKGEWYLPRHYPDGFDGIGTINRIGDGEIVIDDCLYRFEPGLKCATFRQRAAALQAFRPGQQVGFLRSSRRVIASLWSLEPAELAGAVRRVKPPPIRPVPVKPANRLPAAP